MTKRKILKVFIIALVFILAMPSVLNAADYATEPESSSVEYTRTIPSNEGTIKINFTGLTLDEAKPYEFALVRQGGTPEKWFNLDDGYTTTTATVTLSSATSAIVNVLKTTDTGYIYIREKDNTSSYVLEAYKVNLKLPYLQSLAYVKEDDDHCYNVAKQLYGSIGNPNSYIGTSDRTYVQWVKVNDKQLILDYLEIKNNNKDLTNLESSLPETPKTGYSQNRRPGYDKKDDGLYLLWVKRSGENCKDVYSCIVHDGLPEATKVEEYIKDLDVEKPKVESIKVTSPESGTYKTGQTVKITVTFSEEITGTTVPTLKIKFGTSEERKVTNGTISGKNIVYSYNIAEGDKGQLAVTGYTGGTIKDAAGNDATITSPVISGNTIKANVEGTTTNNTENQDKNNNQNKPADNNNENANQNKPADNKNDKPSNGANKNDGTTSTGKLPQTGLGIGLTLAIMLVLAGGIFAYFKYYKLRDI